MSLYEGQEVKIGFCIDYSCESDASKLVVYEIQHFDSANMDFDLEKTQKAILKAEWQKEANSWFNNKYAIDLPMLFDGMKAYQRALLSIYTSTNIYLPPLKIIFPENYRITYEYRKKILDFCRECGNVIFKGKRSMGKGNVEIRNCGAKYCPTLDITLNNYLRTLEPFVIEKLLMYSPRNSLKYSYPSGVYYRDIVLYNTETDELEFSEVYMSVLDLSKTYSSHSENDIREFEAFRKNDPENAKKKLLMAIDNDKNFYLNKKATFINIARALYFTLLMNSSVILDTSIKTSKQGKVEPRSKFRKQLHNGFNYYKNFLREITPSFFDKKIYEKLNLNLCNVDSLFVGEYDRDRILKGFLTNNVFQLVTGIKVPTPIFISKKNELLRNDFFRCKSCQQELKQGEVGIYFCMKCKSHYCSDCLKEQVTHKYCLNCFSFSEFYKCKF